MARFLVFAGLLLACGDLRRAAGAPSILGPPAALPLSTSNGEAQPKEELELESLKMKSRTTVRPAGMKEFGAVGAVPVPKPASASSPPAPTKVQLPPPKAPVNMEHPAPSDNDNENSEKKQQQPYDSPLLSPMEERSMGIYNAEQQDYTPQDIAEYIFWTGDERRIALALNDFLQDELVTKEDVVRFLEDVKRELNNLKARYSSVSQNMPPIFQNLDGFAFDQLKNYYPKQSYLDLPSKKSTLGDLSRYEAWSGRPGSNSDKTYWSSTPSKYPSIVQQPLSSAEESTGEYEEMFEKIRQADAKYREYSLQEIIYQLAKELFSQELQEQPQRSIQRFAHFVENEADLGRIPKDLSKAVLDTLVAALVDGVSEQSKSSGTEQQQLQSILKSRDFKQKLQQEKLKTVGM